MSLLLITATVTPPPDATNLARINPAERLQDYAWALRFYLSVLEKGVFDGVVFVDNSNSDIGALRAVTDASPRRDGVEFISFDGLDYPPEHGRAYGEMRLIRHAMAVSALIKAAPADAVIWKVTGRYVIENAEELVAGAGLADLYCHCRNLPQRWVDMYFMGWRKGAYDALLGGAAERIKDGPGGGSEVAFRELVEELAGKARVLRRFRRPPVVSGTRGYDNQRYEAQRLKTWSRRVLAVIAPWLWI